MKTPIMKCGCAANAVRSKSKGVEYDPPIPCCLIHDCIEVDDGTEINLEGRIAYCSYKGCSTNPKRSSHYGEYDSSTGQSFAPSSPGLPFFSYQPDKEHDKYYCGCWGWD